MNIEQEEWEEEQAKAKSKAAAELTKVFEESDEQTSMNNA